MSASRRELAAMRSAGWEIQTYTPWHRLRALVSRQLVERPGATSQVVPVERWSA
jgi:hypothetical protein